LRRRPFLSEVLSHNSSMRLSIIVPALNEGEVIAGLLNTLQPLRSAGCELILVDGGSTDATRDLAVSLVDCLVFSPPGRAHQMNQGAAVARGEWLWFLHADSALLAKPRDYLAAIIASRSDWGRCDIRLDAPGWIYRMIEWMMNWRSRLTGIATGDQGLFVRRDLFSGIGGYADIPLMEDVELCRRLRRGQRPTAVRHRLQTSARRWQRFGVWRTILLMWRLRLAYFLGVDPERLARDYRQCSSPTRGS